MNVLQALINGLRSVVEGVGRIFEPSDDHYPATGVIPYTGEPYQQNE